MRFILKLLAANRAAVGLVSHFRHNGNNSPQGTETNGVALVKDFVGGGPSGGFATQELSSGGFQQ
jgi:hypothetical protein